MKKGIECERSPPPQHTIHYDEIHNNKITNIKITNNK